MRACIKCGAELVACFGSVLARDMIAYLDGKIPATSIREHCGKCVVALIGYEYGGYGSYEETRAYLTSLGDAPVPGAADPAAAPR